MNYELNNIYNEDCYEAIKLIPDKSIDLIITDPPYFFTNHGAGCFGIKKKQHDYLKVSINTKKMKVDKDKIKQFNELSSLSYGFDYEFLNELDRIMKKINIYIWCSKSQLRKILEHYEEKNCNVDVICWHKTNTLPTINNTYCNDTEYCVFAREIGVKLNGSFETKKKYYVTSTNKEDKDLYRHPTIKPLEIIKNFVLNSSSSGGVVFDPFMGSGTTAVAAKEFNRQYLGFEIDPEYYQIAQDRLNGLTKLDRDQLNKGQLTLF